MGLILCSRVYHKNPIGTFAGILSVFFLFGCAGLRHMLQVQKPILHVDQVRMAGLSLDAVQLAVDVKIHNPMAVHLAGFDYDFQLNGLSFLRRDHEKPLEIPAQGQGKIEIPIQRWIAV